MIDAPLKLPWDLSCEMSAYLFRIEHVSADCLLTPEEVAPTLTLALTLLTPEEVTLTLTLPLRARRGNPHPNPTPARPKRRCPRGS